MKAFILKKKKKEAQNDVQQLEDILLGTTGCE